MRKIIFILLIVVAHSALYSQTKPKAKPAAKLAEKKEIAPSVGEPALSAQQCVDLINDAAQKYLGINNDGTVFTEIAFTGGNLYTVDYNGHTTTKTKYLNIDWTKFDHVFINDAEDRIFVKFSDASIIESATWVNTIVDQQPVHFIPYLFFNIAPSEKGRLNELKKAFEQLGAIAKKKGNPFPPDVVFNEIPGKPGFPDTVKFINDYLRSALKGSETENFLFCNLLWFESCEAHLIIEDGDVYLNSTYIKYDSSSSSTRASKRFTYKIKIKNVEEIAIAWGEGFKGGCLQAGLSFVKSGGSKSEMHVPLWDVAFNTAKAENLKEEQIYKAFDNLRKMVGAKDSLKF